MTSINRTTKTALVALALLGTIGAGVPALAQTCEPAQECGDVDESGAVSASDALRVLKKAVGQPVTMDCSCTAGAGTCEESLAVCTGKLDGCDADLDSCSEDLAECLAPPPPPACEPGGVEVSVAAESPVPADMAGFYDEAFDCEAAEGDGLSGNVDSTHCFRKGDGSSWRLWNTGCGWEIGRVETCRWERYARTYAGFCKGMPPEQLDEGALDTELFFNGSGGPIDGIKSEFCTPAP